MEQEDDAAWFLDVTLERDFKTVLLEMKQNGLIQLIIELVYMGGGISKGEFTPS